MREQDLPPNLSERDGAFLSLIELMGGDMSRWPLIRVPASPIVVQFGCKTHESSRRSGACLSSCVMCLPNMQPSAHASCRPSCCAIRRRVLKGCDDTNTFSLSLFNSGTRMHTLTRSLGCAFLSRLPSCHPMTKRRRRIELPSRNKRDRRE